MWETNTRFSNVFILHHHHPFLLEQSDKARQFSLGLVLVQVPDKIQDAQLSGISDEYIFSISMPKYNTGCNDIKIIYCLSETQTSVGILRLYPLSLAACCWQEAVIGMNHF